MFPCFLLGVFLRNNIDLLRRHNLAALVISFFCFAAALYVIDGDTFLKPTRGDIIRSLPSTSVAMEFATKHSLFLFTGFSGTAFFLALFEYLGAHLPRTRAGEYIGSYGSMTLGVYLMQTLFLEIILFRTCRINTADITLPILDHAGHLIGHTDCMPRCCVADAALAPALAPLPRQIRARLRNIFGLIFFIL